MSNKLSLKKKISGGDGYVINPSIAIAGMPGHTRYSYNLIPVFSGELLENGNGYNSDPTMKNIECIYDIMQIGGNKNKKENNCECKLEKKEKSVFDLIKLKGGVNMTNISQFGAIQSVSKLLMPLGINKLLSLITLIFLFHFSIKTPKKDYPISDCVPVPGY